MTVDCNALQPASLRNWKKAFAQHDPKRTSLLICPPIRCVSGLVLSVQASNVHKSRLTNPRLDSYLTLHPDQEPVSFEASVLEEPQPPWSKGGLLKGTVGNYVPLGDIEEIIAKNGGWVEDVRKAFNAVDIGKRALDL